MKNKVYAVIAVLVVILAGLFAYRKSLPKKFDKIYPDVNSINACEIVHINTETEDKKELSEEQLAQLLELLKEAKYHSEGLAGDVFEGELYHVYFAPMEKDFEVKITDMRKIIIGSERYTMDSDAVSDYIKSVM